MMLKRKIMEQLTSWAETKSQKCLLVHGPGQTGKTYVIQQFGKTKYEEVLEVNFKQMPSVKEVFSGDRTVEEMVTGLRFRYPEKKILPGKTLVFLDEIQECEDAISSLKQWAIEDRYDVIAAGSLIGTDDTKVSCPALYVNELRVYGLDFEEFLWALGVSEDLTASLPSYLMSRREIPAILHSKLMEYFRMYLAIGGMPEAVARFVETRDYREVDRVQRGILQRYQYNMAHYAKAEEKVKTEKCFLTLSRQLLDKPNHKFQYKEIEHGARAQKYFSSIEWLLHADMIHLCKLVTEVSFDLEEHARSDFFRAYPADLSLLIAMKDFVLKQYIVENTLEGSTRGGLYACAIADALHKKGYPLYFYKNKTQKVELDFILPVDGQPIPMEIKSGKSKARPLSTLLKKRKDLPFGYKFVEGNIGVREERILTLPLYMATFI